MREGGASFIGYVGLKGRRSRLWGEALRWMVSAPGDSLPPFFCVLLHRSLFAFLIASQIASHYLVIDVFSFGKKKKDLMSSPIL